MRYFRSISFATALFIIPMLVPLFALHAQQREDDPCGFRFGKEALTEESQLWGYGTDALLADLQNCALHPWVRIDVIGSSVRGVPLYHMVLTNPSSRLQKRRVWVHARTHPIESESSSIARALVEELLSGSQLATTLLDHCIIHILPMLNPDGVNLRLPRNNANGIDLESNWGSSSPEPEVQALRRHLEALMNSSTPIEVALNLHSAYDCKRYFVFHAAEGTSDLFAEAQRRYIDAVRARFPGGIEQHDYFVSWTTGTPDRYPESWFWLNHGDKVLALTYEDMNCGSAGSFDVTARALLGGTGEYLGILRPLSSDPPPAIPDDARLLAVYPNPVHGDGAATFTLHVDNPSTTRNATIDVVDVLGRVRHVLWNGALPSGQRTLVSSISGLEAGVYTLRLLGESAVHTQTLHVLR